MGISILELVLRRLREAKFTADVAFPGQKFPQITKPVAAVHIEKVDRANMAVTVEVNIICPAAIGNTGKSAQRLGLSQHARLHHDLMLVHLQYGARKQQCKKKE